ncbi:MAG: hypothetical protein NC299_06580 [Lachnospiraceae bacterium]|nr:hypothetical protein [Lachnospiraceae bacterium]
MNIEKFIDAFGDDVYALALIVTKSFDSAERVFTQTAQECDTLPETAELYDVVKRAYSLCRKAPSNDNAETLSGIALSARQEALLAEIFARPQITRTAVHLYYENDLTAEQTAEVLGTGARYVSEQLGELGGLSDRLERSYKELCLKLAAPDELKISVMRAVKAGEKRLFEVRGETASRHSWTRGQKIGAVIAAVVVTVLLCIVIPLLSAYLESYEEMNSSYDEVPPELIFSYTTDETEHLPSE